MFWIKKKSDWKFDTSRSLSIGGGKGALGAGASIGTVYLTSPQGSAWSFNYGYVGVSAGLSLLPASFAGSITDFPSAGEIFILSTFDGSELTGDDLTGVCRVQEISVVGAIAGSASAMLLGIPKTRLLKELGWSGFLGPIGLPLALLNGDLDFDWSNLVSSAKALLIMAGGGIGTPSFSAGGSSNFGYLYQVKEDAIAPTLNPPPDAFAPDPPFYRVSYQGREEGPPIILDGNALFCFDQDVINSDGEGALRNAKARIASYPGLPLLVEGHTDSLGPRDYNLDLSRRRARRVKAWLIKNAGRTESDVFAQGYGKDYPVGDNRTPGGRRLNRRVELHIMQSSWVPPRQ